MTRTIALDMLGDARPDIVTLVDGTPVYSATPGHYHATLVVDTTATDIVAVPDGGWDQNDAFLISSDRMNLELWSLDLAQSQWTHTTLGGPMWTNATHLRVAKIDNNDHLDLVGIHANNSTVLYLYNFLQAPIMSTYPHGSPIHRLEVLEWDETVNNEREIALIANDGLHILTPGGTPLYPNLPAAGTDTITIVEQDDLSYDRIAFLTKVQSLHFLYAFDRTTWDSQLAFGQVDLIAGVAGDFAGDGRDDLLFSTKTQRNLVFLDNQKPAGSLQPAFSWGPGVSELFDMTSDGSGGANASDNEAVPTMIDLDLDGDGDIFYPIESDRALAVRHTSLDGGPEGLSDCPSVTGGLYTWNPTDLGNLSLDVTIPGGDANLDRLLIVVWRQVLGSDVELDAIYSDDVERLPDTVTFNFSSDDDPTTTEFIHHVELRLVQLNGNGRIIDSGPAAIHSFTSSNNAREYLVSPEIGGDESQQVNIDLDISDDDEGIQDEGGWTVPLVCLPDFVQDDYSPPSDGR
ncbi:MAG: hypothetical protein AAF682_31540 [Planctomycetota bacterium]